MKLSKKITAGILSLMLTAPCTYATDMNGEKMDINVTVNGTQIEFADQQPVLINNRTLIPIRGVMEAMGKTVSWDDTLQAVVISDNTTTVKLSIGSDVMHQTVIDSANNEEISFEVPLDTAPMLINERTCLPVRAVAEAFMATVDWEEASQTVMIVTADLLC